jgi:hypothetical protein
MSSTLVLQEIYLYPIKSLGGISVSQALVEERGFRYDRRWMLVDKKGDFVTQRQHPQLALLQVALSETQLEVFSKRDPSQRVAFDLDLVSEQELQVSIWGDQVLARVVVPQLATPPPECGRCHRHREFGRGVHRRMTWLQSAAGSSFPLRGRVLAPQRAHEPCLDRVQG